MMYIIINTIQIIGVVIGFLTLVIIALQKASENQKVLLLACTCAFLSILSYTLEINARSLDAMIMALKFGYVGKCYVLLLFLIFMAAYCKVSLPKGIFRFFLIFNTIMLAVIVTCEKHTLYYKNLHISYDGIFPRAVFEKGICYWMFMAGMLFLMIWYLVLSVIELRKRQGLERKQLLLLSMAGIVPSLMLAFYLTGIIDAFDPVPIGIEIACTLLTLNVVKYGLLDTLQLAKEKVIESTKEGLVIVDPNINLLYANKVAIHLFPDIEDVKSRENRLKELFNGDQRETIIESDGRNYEIRVSKITEDNHLGTVKGYLAWIFDMTFINRYTEEMIRLRQEAEKANLAKTSFLAHMSHEIRTPMNAIIGFSDLCLSNDPQGELGEYVGNIKASAETLLNLINQVLDISKIESGKMELVDLEYSIKTLMDEVISGISLQAGEKGLRLRYMIEEQVPSVLYGDKMRVREIASNLLSNAVKYTEEGTIFFKIKEVERKEKDVLLEIIVKDSGIGIREEDKEKLFRKFEQFDNLKNYSQEGTGLGLAIVKSLTELMNGSVEVESTYGEGSIFRARIWQKISDDTPVGKYRGANRDNVVLMKVQKRNEQIVQIQDTSVLVVDDNQVNLKVAYGLLKLYGIEADLVQSGKECLKAAEQKTYDLIFMDQMMPEMDGIETMRCLRKREEYKEVPIVALTANALVGVKEEMLAAGFDDFLGKPMELSELEKILYRFTGKKGRESQKKTESTDGDYEILIKEGIEAHAGETFCGGADEYREALRTFADNGLIQLNNICETLEKCQIEEYEILVHALKSSAAVIGAEELSKLAKAHEIAAKEEKWEFIQENFEPLRENYEKVLEAVCHYIQTL